VPGADRTRRHLTSRPPGHQVPDLCDHPRSNAPGLLLLPRSSSLHAMPHLPLAHHASKRDSPNEIKIKEKQNKTVPDSNSNLAKSMTHHNQTKELTTWFLTMYTGVPKFCMWSCSCLTAHSSVNRGMVSSLGKILEEAAHRGDLATTSSIVAQWCLAAIARNTRRGCHGGA
jgi:hypothetical protein